MIQQGQALPVATLSELTADGMVNHDVTELFANKKVVLFAVPGAFTPTCSEAHLPGYVVLADELKAKGVDLIACVSVNDAFVMQAWGEAQNASEILMWVMATLALLKHWDLKWILAALVVFAHSATL